MSEFSPKQRNANKHPNVSYHPGAAAADATEDWTVFVAPCAGLIRKLSWVPNADVTGAATNHFSISFVNKGTDGNGSTAVGSTVTYDNGTNATDFNEVYCLNPATTSAATVRKDEVIAFRRTKVGTGLAMPEGAVVVEFVADDSDPS